MKIHNKDLRQPFKLIAAPIEDFDADDRGFGYMISTIICLIVYSVLTIPLAVIANYTLSHSLWGLTYLLVPILTTLSLLRIYRHYASHIDTAFGYYGNRRNAARTYFALTPDTQARFPEFIDTLKVCSERESADLYREMNKLYEAEYKLYEESKVKDRGYDVDGLLGRIRDERLTVFEGVSTLEHLGRIGNEGLDSTGQAW